MPTEQMLPWARGDTAHVIVKLPRGDWQFVMPDVTGAMR